MPLQHLAPRSNTASNCIVFIYKQADARRTKNLPWSSLLCTKKVKLKKSAITSFYECSAGSFTEPQQHFTNGLQIRPTYQVALDTKFVSIIKGN